MNKPLPLLVILGPTASGKTRLAARLAAAYDGEIVSADSRQVYRRLNIGTGKDYEDYLVNGQTIQTHLIDICEPDEPYHLHRFLLDATQAISHIQSRQKLPILCGGTGLYIQALLKGYDYPHIPVDEGLRAELYRLSPPELLELFERECTELPFDGSTPKRQVRAIEIARYLSKHPMQTYQKPNFEAFVIGIAPPLAERRARIKARLLQRLEAGLIAEVRQLLDSGVRQERLEFLGLEYKFVVNFLKGKISEGELVVRLTTAIQQFAKRQMTFFRQMERSGTDISWFSGDEPKLWEAVENFLKSTEFCYQKNPVS